MKSIWIIAALIGTAAGAFAQTGPTQPGPAELSEWRVAGRLARHIQLESTAQPNKIAGRYFTYSGIAVQLAKTDHPLQLVNPAAPSDYGPAEQNVTRNPIDGRVSGLKFFSLQF